MRSLGKMTSRQDAFFGGMPRSSVRLVSGSKSPKAKGFRRRCPDELSWHLLRQSVVVFAFLIEEVFKCYGPDGILQHLAHENFVVSAFLKKIIFKCHGPDRKS